MSSPLCEYFGVCGGCLLQDVEYPEQVEGKRLELANAVGLDEVNVFSGPPYGYRCRMDFAFSENGVGFRRKGTWDSVFRVLACPISCEGLNRLLIEVNGFFTEVDFFDIRRQTGCFRYAVIRAPPSDSSVSFVLNRDSPGLERAHDIIRDFSSGTSAANVVVTRVPPKTDHSVSDDYSIVKGSDMLREEYLGRRLWYHVQGFFQNNHEMAERLHRYCRSILSGYAGKGFHLLDLFGGVGTFGIINADLFESVTVVESDRNCIGAARKNAALNVSDNVSVVEADAASLSGIVLPEPLVVVADPPRGGMHPKTVKALSVLRPESIIYVSCNIRQLKTDLPGFKGYGIGSVAMFDFFPQTPHCESVVELTRKD